MRLRRWATGASAVPLHPFLAAAYPVIFLFALNAAEQVTLDPLWIPLACVLAGTASVLIALALLLRKVLRAALLTTVLVVGFFGYGHAWNIASGVLGSQWPLIGAWCLLVLIGLVAAWRAGRVALLPVTRTLNLVTVLALLLNATTMAGAVIALGVVDTGPPADTELELNPPDPGDLPDVYYIVPDRYASSAALRETYDFDNEPFLQALEERGFAVARESHSNYMKTPLSLVSSLNLELLDGEELKAQARSVEDREPIHRLLRERMLVPAALKEIGYEYVHVGNWWPPSITNVDADRTFGYEGQDEFATALAQTTILRAVTEPDAAPEDPWDWRVLRQHTLYALERLHEIPDMPGPKYVFAHLLIPHDPYVFDRDGSFMDRPQVAEQGQLESYRRQLTFVNDQMLRLIDRIIASSEDAVIVLQSDEGPFPERYRANERGFDWREATDAELEEKIGIVHAVRVPGADLEAAGFHDALTPVNTFRIIFNARFGTDLPLLPDRIWAHVSNERFFDFFEVTDRLRR